MNLAASSFFAVHHFRISSRWRIFESRMWLYASGEYSKNHVRIFEYQPDRSGKRPESFLKGFEGCLVTDG
jgi:hypothetical protein